MHSQVSTGKSLEVGMITGLESSAPADLWGEGCDIMDVLHRWPLVNLG